MEHIVRELLDIAERLEYTADYSAVRDGRDRNLLAGGK